MKHSWAWPWVSRHELERQLAGQARTVELLVAAIEDGHRLELDRLKGAYTRTVERLEFAHSAELQRKQAVAEELLGQVLERLDGERDAWMRSLEVLAAAVTPPPAPERKPAKVTGPDPLEARATRVMRSQAVERIAEGLKDVIPKATAEERELEARRLYTAGMGSIAGPGL